MMGDLAAALIFGFGIFVGLGLGTFARYVRTKFN